MSEYVQDVFYRIDYKLAARLAHKFGVKGAHLRFMLTDVIRNGRPAAAYSGWERSVLNDFRRPFSHGFVYKGKVVYVTDDNEIVAACHLPKNFRENTVSRFSGKTPIRESIRKYIRMHPAAVDRRAQKHELTWDDDNGIDAA